MFKLIAFIATLCSIISIPLSIYYFWKSKRFKAILFCSRSITVIEDMPEDERLKLYLGDRSIKRLVITKVAIWNAGNETIRSTDFIASNPLQISFIEPDTVIESYLSYANKKSTEIVASLVSSNKSILLGFEYLDPSDGMVLKVIHEGDSKESTYIEGTFYNENCNKIRSVSKEFFTQYMKDSYTYKKRRWLVVRRFLIPITFLLCFIISAWISPRGGSDEPVTIVRVIRHLFSGIPILGAVFLFVYEDLVTRFVEKILFRYLKQYREPEITNHFISENWSISEGVRIQ